MGERTAVGKKWSGGRGGRPSSVRVWSRTTRVWSRCTSLRFVGCDVVEASEDGGRRFLHRVCLESSLGPAVDDSTNADWPPLCIFSWMIWSLVWPYVIVSRKTRSRFYVESQQAKDSCPLLTPRPQHSWVRGAPRPDVTENMVAVEQTIEKHWFTLDGNDVRYVHNPISDSWYLDLIQTFSLSLVHAMI